MDANFRRIDSSDLPAALDNEKMLKTLSLSALFFLIMGLMITAYASVPV